MRGANVPLGCNDGGAANRVRSHLQNANPRNFAPTRLVTANDSHLVRVAFDFDVAAAPRKMPWVSATTFHSAIVAPGSLLDSLFARTIVTLSRSVTKICN